MLHRFHLGDMVNVVRLGCAVLSLQPGPGRELRLSGCGGARRRALSQLGGDASAIVPSALAGTISGALVVLAQLNAVRAFGFLSLSLSLSLSLLIHLSLWLALAGPVRHALAFGGMHGEGGERRRRAEVSGTLRAARTSTLVWRLARQPPGVEGRQPGRGERVVGQRGAAATVHNA